MEDAPRIKTTTPAVTGPFSSNSLLMLYQAIECWKLHGFRDVDLPWLVQKEFSDATRPPECLDLGTPYGSFVASGEQSFLQLWDAGQLHGARGYVGWTPCLRDDKLDGLHQHGFMKAEWFVPLEAATAHDWHDLLMTLVKTQAEIFHVVAEQRDLDLPRPVDIVVLGPEQVDIELDGVEIGSYGRREFRGRHYLYGTALALPRFTLAMA